MPKRITLTVHDDVLLSVAISELADWFQEHESDPDATPLRGLVRIPSEKIILVKSPGSSLGFQCFAIDPSEDSRG